MRATTLTILSFALTLTALPVVAQEPAPPVPPEESGELRAQLQQKDAELAELRGRLEELEGEADYQDARRLGVVDAVQLSTLPPHVQRRVALAVVREARRHNVDPLLVVAVIQTESAFDAFATSPVGALGLMQVMPGTGQYLAEQQGLPLGRTSNLFDPELNVALGVSYLADLVIRFGSVEWALVAYNQGPGAASVLLASDEQRPRALAGYPAKVLRNLQGLQSARRARPEPARLPVAPVLASAP